MCTLVYRVNSFYTEITKLINEKLKVMKNNKKTTWLKAFKLIFRLN